MRTIKIILEVDVNDIDWGKSSTIPVGNGLYDTDIDHCKYEGQVIDFVDDDKACDYIEFLYLEAEPEYGAHG